MNIGDREVGARRVRRLAELASNNHALGGPRGVPERARGLDWCAREVARKGILVEENSAVVLGDHVEVPRQGTVSDKSRTLLNADHMPRDIEVRSQHARVRPSCRARIPGEDLELVCLAPIPLIRAEGGSSRSTRGLLQEFRCWLPISIKVRNEGVVRARRAGLLDAPSIHPITVVLAITSQGVVDTEPQRKVHCAKPSQTAICIRSWRRREALWQAYWRGRRYSVVRSWWRRMTAAAGHSGSRLAMAAGVGAQIIAVLIGRRGPAMTTALRV